MHALKQKWKLHKTYQRLKKLWEDYKDVSQLGDNEVIHSKLSAFLDTFQSSVREVTGKDIGIVLNEIYGDMSEVFVSVVDFIEKELDQSKSQKDVWLDGLYELVNKALSAAELILQDEKYRVMVKDTPHLIERLLSLLEKVETTEAKKLAVRVISNLGINDENKLEIGRLEGFRKILHLLVAEGDTDLKREILRSIRTMIDVHQAKSSGQRKDGGAEGGGSTAEFSEASGDDHHRGVGEDFPIGTGGGVGGRDGDRNWIFVSSEGEGSESSDRSSSTAIRLVSDVTKVLLGEITKIFPRSSSSGVPSSNDQPLDFEQQTAFLKQIIEECVFPPTPQEIETEVKSLQSSSPTHSQSQSSGSEQQTPSNGQAAGSNPTETKNDSLWSGITSLTGDEGLKELMVMQGALQSLTSALNEAALTLQLDVLETISKLVANHGGMQEEMRRIKGYLSLAKMFELIAGRSGHEGSNPDATLAFLRNCFDLMFVITLDGNKSKRAGNLDCLEMLCEVVATSSHPVVQLESILCIQDLLLANPINAVRLVHVGGLRHLFSALRSFTSLPQNSEKSSSTLGIEPTTPSPLLPSVAFLTNLVGFLMSGTSPQVIEMYIQMLEDASKGEINFLSAECEIIILRSITTLLSDLRARHLSIPSSVSSPLFALFESAAKKDFGAAGDRTSEQDHSGGDLETWEAERLLAWLECIGHLIKDSPQSLSETQTLETISHIISSLSPTPIGGQTLPSQSQPTPQQHHAHFAADIEGNGQQQASPSFSNGSALNANAGGVVMVSSPSSKVQEACLWLLVQFYSSGNPCAIKKIDLLVAMLAQCTTPVLDSAALIFRKIEQTANAHSQSSPTAADQLKTAFREHGGLDRLFLILQSKPSVPVAYAAFCCLGEAVTNCEQNKTYVGSRLSYKTLSSLLLSTLPSESISRDLMEYILELSCTGSLRVALNRLPLTSTPNFICGGAMAGPLSTLSIQSWSYSTPSNLLELQAPRPLFASKPPLSRPRSSNSAMATALTAHKDSPNNSQPTTLGGGGGGQTPPFTYASTVNSASISMSGNLLGSGATMTTISGSPLILSHSSSSSLSMTSLLQPQSHRASSSQPLESPRHASSVDLGLSSSSSFNFLASSGLPLSSSPSRRESSSVPTELFSESFLFGRQRSMSQTSGEQHTHTSSHAPPILTRSDSDSLLTCSTESEENISRLAPLLVRCAFRDEDTIKLSFRLIAHAPSLVQQESTKLVLLLCDANPRNMRTACQAKLVSKIMPFAEKCDEECQSHYYHLLASLCAYTITPDEARLLLCKANFFPVESTACSPRSDSDLSHFTGTLNKGEYERQMQMLFVVGHISESICPKSYFSLDGIDGHMSLGPFERFPGSGGKGYTLSCWVKLGSVLVGESTLFSWHDNAGCSVLKLAFKKMETAKCTCVLTATIQQQNAPSQTVTFEHTSFREGGAWHHLIIGHSKDSMSIYVDGQLVQTKPCPSFPNTTTSRGSFTSSSKERGIIGYVGCAFPPPASANWKIDVSTSKQSGGVFCGQLGAISVHEGLCDATTATKWFAEGGGALSAPDLKSSGLSEFISVFPDAKSGVGSVIAQSNSSESLTNLANSGSSTGLSSTQSSTSSTPTVAASPIRISMHSTAVRKSAKESSVLVKGGVDVHETQSLREVIEQIGGIKLCFSLIRAQQTPGLRILSGLLCGSRPNTAEFVSLSGLSVLHNLLSAYPSELCMETIEILFDLILNPRCFLNAIDVLNLISDLTLCATPTVKIQILRSIFDFIVSSQQNMKMWRTPGPGLSSLLEYLFDSHPAQMNTWVLRLIERVCVDVSAEELELLFSEFVPSKSRNELLHPTVPPTPQPSSSSQGGDQSTPTTDTTAPASERRGSIADSASDVSQRTSMDGNGVVSHGGAAAPPSPGSSASSPALVSQSASQLPSTPTSHALDQTQDGVAAAAGSSEEEDSVPAVKVCLLQQLYEIMQTVPTFLDLYSSTFGLNITFSLMVSPNEDVRVLAVKILGLQLHCNPKLKSAFVKGPGFDTLCNHLSFFAPSGKVLSKLFGLALDSFLPIQPAVKTSSGKIVTSQQKQQLEQQASHSRIMSYPASDSAVIYPEAIRAVLDLLAPSDDEDLHLIVLDVLEKVLQNPTTLALLLDSNFLEWWASYLQSTTKTFPTFERAHAQAMCITNRTVRFDLCRSPKQSRLHKLKDMQDFEISQNLVLHCIVEELTTNPRLSDEESQNLLKNLANFLSQIEECFPMSHLYAFDLIAMINAIASENNFTVRSRMKSLGLFQRRDEIMLYMLKSPGNQTQVLIQAMAQFPLESLSEQPLFKDGNTVLLLLKILHDQTIPDPRIQIAAARMLRAIFNSEDGDKKSLLKAIEDQSVISRLLAQHLPDSHMGTASPSGFGVPIVGGVGVHMRERAGSGGIPPSFVQQGRTASPSRRHYGMGGSVDSLPMGDERDERNSLDEPYFDSPEEDIIIEEFLEWYFNEEQRARREAVQARIAKQWQPFEASLAKNVEKSNAKKLKQVKSRKEEVAKAKSSALRHVIEFEEKRKAFMKKLMGTCDKKKAGFFEQRQGRITAGQESWTMICAALDAFFGQTLSDTGSCCSSAATVTQQPATGNSEAPVENPVVHVFGTPTSEDLTIPIDTSSLPDSETFTNEATSPVIEHPSATPTAS